MTTVMDKRVEADTVGEYSTLRAIALDKECTKNALYKWIRYYNIPHVIVGKTVLVRKSDIVGYVPRGK